MRILAHPQPTLSDPIERRGDPGGLGGADVWARVEEYIF